MCARIILDLKSWNMLSGRESCWCECILIFVMFFLGFDLLCKALHYIGQSLFSFLRQTVELVISTMKINHNNEETSATILCPY